MCPDAVDAVQTLKDRIFLVISPGKLAKLIAKNSFSNGGALIFEASIISGAVKRGEFYNTGFHLGKILDILLSEK